MNGVFVMKNIGEVKFNEVRQLTEHVNTICDFNAGIKTMSISINDLEDGSCDVVFGGSGSRTDFLRMYAMLTENLTKQLYKMHPCDCIPVSLQAAAGMGISEGLEEAKKEGE